jgi:hypothetical protein
MCLKRKKFNELTIEKKKEALDLIAKGVGQRAIACSLVLQSQPLEVSVRTERLGKKTVILKENELYGKRTMQLSTT